MEVLEPALAELHERMLAKGIPVNVATKVCEDIRPFAGYGFNLSHAAAYALIAYQTAYLKANYPLEYMCAVLQVFYTDEDKVTKYTKVIQDMGIQVLPPDVNRSEMGFTIDGDNAIRFGLGSIKGLGEATVEAILKERTVREETVIRNTKEDIQKIPDELELAVATKQIAEEPDCVYEIATVMVGGEFTSCENLMARLPKRNLNKKSLTALALSGCFDEMMGDDFNNRFEYLAHVLESRGDEPDAELITSIAKYSDRIKFDKEKEYLGMYVSGHALSRLAAPTDWEGLDEATHFTMVSLIEARIITTKKGDEMAFLKVDTLEGVKDLTLFPKQFSSIERDALVEGMLIKVGLKGSMNWQRNKKDFIVASITIPKKINRDLWKKIELKRQAEEMVTV